MPNNYRMERIERLLKELEYEVTRGMLENDVNEHLGFRWIVPLSRAIPNGVVQCEFRTRPVTMAFVDHDIIRSGLKLVVGGPDDA